MEFLQENVSGTKLSDAFTDVNRINFAFYTYFYGSNIPDYFSIPEVPFINYNCYYFTNNINLFEELKHTKWIVVFDDIRTDDNTIESNFAGKKIKTCPELFPELSNYDYLCYFDGIYLNKEITCDEVKVNNENIIEKHINNFFIKQNYALLLHLHPFIKNNNIWEEFKESMLQYRYNIHIEEYTNYINSQINSGLKEQTEYHFMNGFLLRNMKHSKIHEINNSWYKNILLCGIQDQISFFFSKQPFSEYIHPIPFFNLTSFIPNLTL